MDDAEVVLPSYARRTDKGGYAHTTSSRRKIGEANKGNVPWNKGKNRSEESKAKIRLAVGARNQAILDANLKKIGMSQEEYDKVKAQLKYVRERVRKCRLGNIERIKSQKAAREKIQQYLKYGHSKEAQSVDDIEGCKADGKELGHQENLLSEACKDHHTTNQAVVEEKSATMTSLSMLESTTASTSCCNMGQTLEMRTDSQDDNCSPQSKALEERNPADKRLAAVDNTKQVEEEPSSVDVGLVGPDDETRGQETPSLERAEEDTSQMQTESLSTVFKRDIAWDVATYDDQNVLYHNFCPEGGPGGLICCSFCSSQYMKFLSDTQKNLEHQQFHRTTDEVESISQFVSTTMMRLKESVSAAQKCPPSSQERERRDFSR